MLEHVKNLGNQLLETLEKSSNFKSIQTQDVLIVGMGGSGVAGDVLKLAFDCYTEVNATVVKTYNIPQNLLSRNPHCLFLSYSGNTEETLSVLESAIKFNLEWSVVSSGGKLLNLAKEHKKSYVLVPNGLQPRAAFGYMAKAALSFYPDKEKPHFEEECFEAGTYLNSLLSQEDRDLILYSNSIAKTINKKTSVIYGGTDLTYLVAQRWKTQINENSKSKAFVGFMPEVHHNEILSWESNKEESKNNYQLIFLRDENEHPQVKKRFELTKEILREMVDIIEIKNVGSSNIVKSIFHLTLIGDLVSVFIANELNVDPYNIVSIEKLKSLLKG